MPYVPRSPTSVACAHCGQDFQARHARRTYCSHSCNVLASYARNGRRRAARPPQLVPGELPAVAPLLPPLPPEPTVPAAAAHPVPTPDRSGTAFVQQFCRQVVVARARQVRDQAESQAFLRQLLAGKPDAPQ